LSDSIPFLSVPSHDLEFGVSTFSTEALSPWLGR
jgi:hypothetical protein